MRAKVSAALPLVIAMMWVAGPAASGQSGAGPATVSGEWSLMEVTKEQETRGPDGVWELRGQTFDLSVEADDPRLSGSGTLRRADDYIGADITSDGSGFNVRADRWRIENEGGTWDGTTRSLWFFSEEDLPEIYTADIVLVGAGGYDGLTAILSLEESHAVDAVGDLERIFKGVILHREPPDVPEA